MKKIILILLIVSSFIHGYTQDKTPQDAVDFLNQCAEKFKISGSENKAYFDGVYTDNGSCEISFKLEGSSLIVNKIGKLESGRHKKHTIVVRHKISIELSKCFIEKLNVEIPNPNNISRYIDFYSGDGMIQFVHDKNFKEGRVNDLYLEKLDNTPCIISSKSYIESSSLYENILYQTDKKYRPNLDYTDDEFIKNLESITPILKKKPIVILNYFNEKSSEFIEGNYTQRIPDAFEFLINHFGGNQYKEAVLSKQKSEQKNAKF